jgi:hypothetical protein
MPNQNPRKPFPAWRLPKGMINANDDELEKSIESCEVWEWFGGGLVIVGVAATVVIAAIHPKYDSFWEQWGSAIADSLVAIGVAIEIKFGQMAGLRQKEQKRRSDIIVGAANVRAAEANQKAEESALKLAQLEKKITPRVIGDEQAEKIIEKIKSFPGTPFEVKSDPAAEYVFVNRVIEVLQQAGWKWQAYSTSLTSLPFGDIGIPNPDGSGVQIRINKSRYDGFFEPAQSLAFALADGLSASVSIVGDPPDSPLSCSSDAIHVEIRRKL